LCFNNASDEELINERVRLGWLRVIDKQSTQTTHIMTKLK